MLHREYDDNNLFARVLRGELPCARIFEDEDTLAFLDIMPQSEGHSLIIPKARAVTLLQLPPAIHAATLLTVQRVAAALIEVTGAEGLLVSQFNGEAAGQTVPHVHFHVIPRWEGERLKSHARERVTMDELLPLAEKISAAIVRQAS